MTSESSAAFRPPERPPKVADVIAADLCRQIVEHVANGPLDVLEQSKKRWPGPASQLAVTDGHEGIDGGDLVRGLGRGPSTVVFGVRHAWSAGRAARAARWRNSGSDSRATWMARHSAR